MSSDLCIGIVPRDGSLALAALDPDHPAVQVDFPATPMGVAAIKIALMDHQRPVRLAVAGDAALDLALALGTEPGLETVVVSSAVANQPMALARYAGRMA
jgi:hypothetical protein